MKQEGEGMIFFHLFYYRIFKVMMITRFNTILFVALSLFVFCSCRKVKEQTDQLYSRHLQRQVKLTIINTPVPGDKSKMNLIIFNDGQLLDNIGMKEIVADLYAAKKINPVVIVGVHADNRLQEYGIADYAKSGGAGNKADHYAAFINNELYAYAKKNAGVRKFYAVTIAGFGAGALSALDIAWDNADKISKTGIFSGAFSRTENKADTTAKGEMYEKIKASRKRPKTAYWFYAGKAGDAEIKSDDATDIETHTNAFMQLLGNKSFINAADIVYQKGNTNNIVSWKLVMPDFLEWAIGK
ncbi:MAG: alpha/beta hydrolase-fold protein [Agriterribacter sp.]